MDIHTKIKKLPFVYRQRFGKLIPLLSSFGKLKIYDDKLYFKTNKKIYLINIDNEDKFIRDVEYLEEHLLDLQKIAFINKLKAE